MCIYFIFIVIVVVIIRDVSVISLTAGAEKAWYKVEESAGGLLDEDFETLQITSCHWQSLFEQVYNYKDHCHTCLHNLCCLDILVKSK